MHSKRRKNTRRKTLLAMIASLLAVVLMISSWFIVSTLTGEKETAMPEKKPALESIQVETFSDHMIVMDLTHNKVLFKKAAGEKTRPASLAKMMSALVIIENTSDFDERVKIPHDIYNYLHGSGIAVAGFEDGENKAKEIGMKSTTFGNCIGLDNPACYTTARDLLKLTRYALKNEEFRNIFASSAYTIEPTNKCDQSHTIKNAAIQRFGADRVGVIGGKSGNTIQAKLCLVTIAKIDGCEYVCVSTHASRTEDRYNPHVDDARTVYREIKRQLGESGQ